MAKVTLSDLTTLANDSQAVLTINQNMAAIAAALENTLSRDGTTPNQLISGIDANSQRIINLPVPVNGTEPLRKMDSDIGTIINYVQSASASATSAAANASNAAAAKTAAQAAQAAAEAAVATATAAWHAAYPVGSVYINASVSTNPATLLGFGTWTSFGVGRVLVGLDGTQTEFDTLGETGGEKTHTLTVDEMPAHTHKRNSDNYSELAQTGHGGSSAGSISGDQGTYYTDTGSAGGGQAHNNLQPYIVVSMWVRTA